MILKENIKTACGDFEYIETGIVKIMQYYDSSATLEDAKEHVRLLREYVNNEQTKFIIDIRNLGKTTNAKMMREYFSSPEANEFNKASAVLIKSGLSRMLGNFFIKASKPPYPIKLFTKEDLALEWLRAQS